VENLWQSLQDMLSDDSASSRVYFVLNNLHALPGESEATKKLIDLIKGEMKAMNDVEINRTSVRWMVTSRKSKKSIIDILNAGGIRLIDLEDDKYADQVQLELRKHAQQKVSILGTSKKYRKDLAYFVSSLIGNRAQNTGWIDLTCGQLEELPDTESALRVRQVLKRLPRGLDDLLDQGWRQIFEANPDHAEKIKEMLQALILTYEDPTLLELAVLAGFPADDEGTQELRELTGRCNTFLTLKGKNETKVSFKHVIVKPHLLRHANQLLGVSEEEIKWLHGELALRSFSHLIERFDVPEPEQQPAKTAEGSAADEAGDAQQNEEQNDEQDENRVEEEDASSKSSNSDDGNEDGKEENSDTESEDTTSEASESEVTALPYMVKHWLHHASKATTEMADDLSREEEFWKPGSSIRRRWLMQYDALTYAFNEFDEKSFAALHVAASIGFRQLVVALLRNGYENELDLCDNQDNTPLHFAAFFGRPNIVEELLSRGVNIDGGKDEGNATPVFMAAYTGSVRVLKMLLTAGADPNAADKGLGTPLNAAINSGNLDAVKILVAKGVSLSLSSDSEHETALSCAARLPDSAMFDYIIETGADVLSPHDYNTAFIASAYQGTVDIFRKLLEYEHDQETLQEALVQATDECEWDIVRIILRMYPGLDCNKLFEAVATGYDNEDELLNIIWEYADGSISANTLNDAIYLATDNEKESTVKYLLETCKASPNAVGDYYGNALTAAAYDGTLDMVKMLLDSGADIKSPNGWALQTAAGEGHEEVVKELLARGADVNAHSDNPNFPQGTALQAACEAGRKDIAKLLLENKADPNVGGGDYTCPIIAAARKGEADILELLVEYKAKVDVFGGPDSSTPLINAAMFLPTKYLKLLLDAGANINLADPDGDTALIMTSLRGDSESVEFLLKNGADAMAVSKTRKINALQAAFQGEDRRCLELVIDHVSEMLQKKGDVKSSDEPEDNDDADSEATGAGIEHSENEASGDEDSHAVSDEETEETDGSDEEGDE
jgi:ankyrin repeat protein